MRMRHSVGRQGVSLRMDDREVDPVDVLVRMRQQVMRREIVWGSTERPLVETKGRAARAHAVPVGGRILRLSHEQQQLHIILVLDEDLVQPVSVHSVGGRVSRMRHGVELTRAQLDAKQLALGDAARKRLRPAARLARAFGQAQLAERFAESDVCHGEL